MSDFDGFISRREDGGDFAKSLMAYLSTHYKIKCMIDSKLGQLNDENHVLAAEQGIESSKFVVVVVGENKFEPQTDTRESFQQMEVEYALKVRQARKGSENEMGLFFVHLNDDPSASDDEELRDAIRDLRRGHQTNFKHTYNAPLSLGLSDEKEVAIETVASAIRTFLDESGYITWDQQKKVTSNKAAFIPERLEIFEKIYLQENIDYWLKGHLGEIQRAGGDSAKDQARRALFDFNIDRGLVLNATELDDESSGGENIDSNASPVLKSIFSNDRDISFLTGTSGSGKTTALTLSAAFLAMRLDESLVKNAKVLMESEVGATAQLKPGAAPFVPVVIACSSLGESLDANKLHLEADYQSLIAHIVDCMEISDVADKNRIDIFKYRLSNQPYAFFFDALDEVTSKANQTRIVSAIKWLRKDLIRDGNDFRIIISAREKAFEDKNFIEYKLANLTDAQVTNYFDRFANTYMSDDNLESELVATLRRKYQSDQRFAEVLTLPFNLNCFCFLVGTTSNNASLDNIPNTQAGLMQMIIRNLTDGVNLPEIAGRKLSSEAFRMILRRFAFDVLTGKQKGSMSIPQAVQRLHHTLSTDFSLQSGGTHAVTVNEHEVRVLLDNLVAESDLLHVEKNSFYAFERQKFCEYLAAERLDIDALAQTFIRGFDARFLPDLTETFAFCYALRLQRGVYRSARSVLEALTHRARENANAYKDRKEEASLQNAFKWLEAAIYCAAAGTERQLQAPANQREENGLYEVIDSATTLLSDLGKKLNAVHRNSILTNLMALCRQPDCNKMIASVREIIGSLTDSRDVWEKVVLYSNVSDRQPEFSVARWPVLVCEFEEFLIDDQNGHEHLVELGVWDHAPTRQQKTIMCQDPVGRVARPASEYWREMRHNLGNPVTMITWYEAVAYAKWLTLKLQSEQKLLFNQCVRLPTRNEMMQIMISSSEGGDYPWGEEFLENEDARVNYRYSGIKGVSAVGVFQKHKNIIDLGSNVKTWSINNANGEELVWPPESKTEKRQPVMGGSWWSYQAEFTKDRAPDLPPPHKRDATYGFRLVMTEI